MARWLTAVLCVYAMPLLWGCGGEPDCVTDFRSCSTDEDCIGVPVGDWCGCGQGGESTGINAVCEEEWFEVQGPEGGLDCAQVYLCDMEAPVCRLGRCVYR